MQSQIFQGILRWFAGFALRISYCALQDGCHEKEHLSNIMKMKLTEEKRYWTYFLWLFLAEMRLNVQGMCLSVSSMCGSEFDFLTENLNSGC